MKLLDHIPGFLGGFTVLEKLKVLVLDDALVGQELEINDPVPVLFAVEDDRNILHSTGLTKRQGREQFIERAESTWEAHDRFGAKQKMHFPDREIIELKTHARCNV